MAAKGIQFHWRWDGGTISTNLDGIWGMSDRMLFGSCGSASKLGCIFARTLLAKNSRDKIAKNGNSAPCRAKIGGLEVKFRGRKNLTVTVFRNGKQLASDTTHDAGTPTELAYDNGPHPRLIIYLDFRDAVGRWWVIPLQ